MATVILAMAFLPDTRSQFLMSGVTLAVILVSFEVVRRRNTPDAEPGTPAPTSVEPSNQPSDSERHSVLTRPHAGVCRKLTARCRSTLCCSTKRRCSSAVIGRTVRGTPRPYGTTWDGPGLPIDADRCHSGLVAGRTARGRTLSGDVSTRPPDAPRGS